MMRKTRIPMTLSVPVDIAQDYTKMARQESKNRSELFREMFKVYKAQVLKEEFFQIQKYGSKLAKKKKIFTEADVERIISKGRRKR